MSVNCRICDNPSGEGNNLEILNFGFIKQRFPLFLSRGLSFSSEDNVCEDCYQIVHKVSDLIKLVEGKEKEIETLLETLSGKFATNGNVPIFPIDDSDIKPEPEDWNDVDLNDFELVRSEEEKPVDDVDNVSPKREKRRHRKRKLHFDEEVTAPIVPESPKRTIRKQTKEGNKRKKEFIVIVRNEDNEGFVFDIFSGPPKLKAFDENCPNQEVKVSLENIATLLPPNIKDNLEGCKFIVKQKIKEEEGTVPKKVGRPRKDNFKKNVPKNEILDDEEMDLETIDNDEEFSPEIEKDEFEDSDYSETSNKARKKGKSRKRQKKEDKDFTLKVENVDAELEPLKPKRKRNRTKPMKDIKKEEMDETEQSQSPRNTEGKSIREIFEPDPTKIADLTEVNGKKYYLNYAFEQKDNEMTCGFPNCQYKIVGESDEILNSKMMKHIWNAHFPKKPEYKDPKASHQCEICHELPPMKIVEFRKHYRSFHPSLFLSENPKFNEVVCRFCAKPFVQFAGMKIHEWSHYSEAELNALAAQGFPRPQHSKNIPSGSRLFSCQHCPKQFRKNQAFQQHQITTHTDPKDRPRFLCTICGKEVMTERGMTMHNQRFHDQDKFLGRYKICPICDKRFILKPQLDNHMIRHHGREKPIVCEICGWKFTSMWDLKKHLPSHQPIDWRPFSCKLCSEAYRYKSNLVRHIEKVHGVEHLPPKQKEYPLQPKLTYQGCKQMYPCPICEKVFELPSRMKKHHLTRHKDQIVDMPRKMTKNTHYEEDQEFMPDEAEIAIEYILT